MRKLIVTGARNRSQYFRANITEYLHPGGKILDVGSGTSNIAYDLQTSGYNVTGLDVENVSFIPAFTPVIYDGKTIPFQDKTFDTALILTVLHHTTNVDQIIREAVRVANQVIILEDVYTTTFRKYMTYFFDSLINLEFVGHPHSNQSDAQWRQTFIRLGLEITATKPMHSFVVMQHQLYVLRSASK